MDRQREKRLPPTPSGDRENSGVVGRSMSGNSPPLPSNPANRGHSASPLDSGTYSHPRAAPAPPATSSTAAYSPTAPSFPLSSPPGLNDYKQPHPHSDPQPQPQTRRPLRPAPWRTPTSPPRPPPGRLFERALLSPNPQRPAQKASRSGSLPSIDFSQREVGEQQGQLWTPPRPDSPHPRVLRRGPSGSAATRSTETGAQYPFARRPVAVAPAPIPPVPEKSPRRSVVGNNRERKRSQLAGELDGLEGRLEGLGVTVGEVRRKVEYHEEARRAEHDEESRRPGSTDSTYSQGSEGEGSVYAETYHGFMFGDHDHGEGSQKYADGAERKNNNQNRELPQIFSPTTARTPSPPLESHYRRHTPIAPPVQPRARLGGRGEVEPTSPTPIRTITVARITRKPARLRPVSTQQDLRTPSPLSATLKGPGPHVPDGDQWETSPDTSTNDASAAGGASQGAPMFARELTASPEVMSSVAEEEDERRGMVSRWSTDSSDLSDSSDEEAIDMEVSPVPGSLTREVGREAGQESAQKPSEEYHEAQEVAQETPSARDSTNTSSGSDPSPASQKYKRTEKQYSEDATLPFNNLTTQLAALEASLNHLVSHASDLDTAFGQVRDAMIALREKVTETLADTQQFLDEIQGVEGQLAEVRRAMKGKGKEKEFVGSSDGNQDGREEDKGQGEENDNDKGDQREQGREVDQRTEQKEEQHHPETSPDMSPKEPPRRPRRGPPSGPAPGGTEWV